MDSGINFWKISPQIHLWVISLQKRPDDSILSLDERRKADMYIMEKDRIAYLCARSGLRKILSFYCNIPPQLLRFATSVYGKPYLIGNERIQFNLSHTGALGVVAISKQTQIGIDAECVVARDNLHYIAKAWFFPDEYDLWKAAPVEEQYEIFYRFWTVREAYGKALGIGLDESLAKVNLLIPPPGWNIETFKLEREGQDYIVTTAFFHRRNVVV